MRETNALIKSKQNVRTSMTLLSVCMNAECMLSFAPTTVMRKVVLLLYYYVVVVAVADISMLAMFYASDILYSRMLINRKDHAVIGFPMHNSKGQDSASPPSI